MRWRRRTGRAAIAAACGLIVTLVLTGCVGRPGAQLGPRFVTPPLIHYTSVLWPVPLQLVGAEPGSRVRLVASLDSVHGRWSSAVTYTVPASGTVDLATAKPQLAAFSEPDSAGLFWSLRGPHLTSSVQFRLWMRTTVAVTIDAFDDARVIASRVFLLDGLGTETRPTTVYSSDLDAAAARSGDAQPPIGLPDPPPPDTHANGPIGVFYSARSIERPRTPAVIVFDDPADGASADYVAPLLAQFSASVFVLPVTRDSDGMHSASAIDSTTLTAVLDWLAERPDVNQRDIFVYGTSQSEQLALWTATRFAGRVRGVFAAGGASTLLCLPGGLVSPAFENGIGMPCQRNPDQINDFTVLPLDTVPGPVVLGCAGRDEVLPNSCLWLDAAVRSRGTRAGDQIVRAPDAVHAMTVPPGLPIALPGGAAAQATEKARVAFWDAVGGVLLRAAQQ
jgi:dienelactone hydrolase